MAIANPRNLDSDHIMLEDTYFKLKSPVIRVNMSSQFPGKIVIGDYGLNDNPIISTYNIVDLRGGMGMWRYPSQAGVISDTDRYWNAQNFNPAFPSAMTLGPKANTLVSTVAQTNNKGSLFIDSRSSSAYIGWVNSGTAYYKTDLLGSTWSGTAGTFTAGTYEVGKVVSFQGTLIIPTTDTANIWGWAGAISVSPTSLVALPASATSAGFNYCSYSVLDNRLYGIREDGAVVSYPAGFSTATILGTLDIPNYGYPGFKLVVFDDSNSDNTLWVIGSNGAWIYDVASTTFIRSKINLMPRKQRYYQETSVGWETPDAVAGDRLLLVRNNLGLLSVQSNNGAIVLEDISLDKNGISSSNITEIYAIDSWERDEFFAWTGKTNTSSNDANLLWNNGRGFHPLYTGVSNAKQSPHSMATGVMNNGTGVFKAVCAFVDNTVLKYVVLDDLRENPLFSTTRTYATSGYVELPIFDAGYEAQNKMALKMRIKCSHASATETVQVSYRTNVSSASDSYTNLGSAITANTEQILYFGTNSQGLEFKNIQFKFTLASAGSTLAPIIEYISVDFMRLPEVLRGFTVTLDTSSEGSLTEAELNEKIWSLVTTNNLLSFTYKDNTSTERSFLVKPLSPDGVEHSGNREGGQYTLYLVELNNP